MVHTRHLRQTGQDMFMQVVSCPTQKHGARANNQPPTLLLIHSTDMPLDLSLEMLTTNPREVSAHYLIGLDGLVHALVPEDRRAWHAGKSFWRGEADVNSASIGIELVWPGDRVASDTETPGPFTPSQMAAVVELSQGIVARWRIKPDNILAHSDVAPARKRDPGERFDWDFMARHGLGLYPPKDLPPTKKASRKPEELVSLLERYGYDVSDPKAAVRAFQRHFRPVKCNGMSDGDTKARLVWLLEKLGR
jgi:N-acetylmuramoyl-L-alanine amidase